VVHMSCASLHDDHQHDWCIEPAQLEGAWQATCPEPHWIAPNDEAHVATNCCLLSCWQGEDGSIERDAQRSNLAVAEISEGNDLVFTGGAEVCRQHKHILGDWCT